MCMCVCIFQVWLIRIYIYILCVQDIVRWVFGGDAQAFNENQKRTRNSMAALYSLDRIDEVGEAVPESWDAQANDALEGHMAQRSPYKKAGLGRGDVNMVLRAQCR